MKVIVPVDFSEVSNNAFNASILFAKKTDAEIEMFHCIELPFFWNLTAKNKALITNIKEALIDSAQEKLEKYQGLLEDANIECSYSIIEKEFKSALLEESLYEDIDLVIIGSNGASGKRERFIGSNTQKILRKIDKPVLVIKNPVEELKFDKAVYVTGLFKNEQEAFRNFLKYLSIFETKELHILSIDTLAYFSQPSIVMENALEKYAEIAGDFNVTTHFYKDFSVDAGVRHFCIENNIDLIGISNSHKHPLKRLFQGSNVEYIANHNQIPILTIT